MIPVTVSQNREDEYYLDTSLITFDRNFVEASVKVEYKNPSSNGVSSVATRWKANCSYRSTMIIAVSFYGLDGNFLGSSRKTSGWGAITPGSVGENIYYSMCNQFRR